MKHLIILSVFLFASCSREVPVIIKPTIKCPVFPINNYKKKDNYIIEIFEFSEDNNTYIAADKDGMFGLIKYSKEIKTDYNQLVDEINSYNAKIKEINGRQQN